MSDDEIPAYDDPYPTPAMERINAECQARIDAHYEGKAQMRHQHMADVDQLVSDKLWWFWLYWREMVK
jgi:hypothetical protein